MSTSLVTDEPEDRQVENVMLPPAGLVWSGGGIEIKVQI